MSSDPFISHYTLDGMGRRVLVGLTFDETTEFEMLDVHLPHDRKPLPGNCIISLGSDETRWLQLYKKHRAAFDAMSKRIP